jgi:hypothetical protein
MYSPEGRPGRRPGSVKLVAAAVSIALMGMAGAALAAPKADPGPPEQAQANGAPPQAQGNGPPPHAQSPPPAQARARPNAKGSGKPVAALPEQPPQAGGQSNSGPGAGQGLQGGTGHHGRPAPGEIRGQGRTRSKPAKANGCQAARCRGGTPVPSVGASDDGVEQPKPSRGKRGAGKGDLVGVSEERPDHDQVGAAPDFGSVQGLNQGGGEEAYAARGSFDGALPFTGFELALLAAIGALLGLAGLWLRRSIA